MATVVIATDSMKGSATAADVVVAIRQGWLETRPADTVVCVPMADGGEGTVSAFRLACPDSVWHTVSVVGPDGSGSTTCRWLELPDRTGVLEVASSCGIELVDRLVPYTGSTRGLGEVVVDALAAGMTRLVIGIGSSCSTDGGAGFLQALGARLEDSSGLPIGPGLAGVSHVARVDLGQLIPAPEQVSVLCDVVNPLTGPRGAAWIFGPQKGLVDEDMAGTDEALGRLCRLIGGDSQATGGGAAGGLGMALQVWGGQLVPGAAAVAELVGLERACASADVVITGEGRFDESSWEGKVPSLVARAARSHGARLALVAGTTAPGTDVSRFDDVAVLSEIAGDGQRARADALGYARLAGRDLARRFNETPSVEHTSHRRDR